LTFNIIQSIDYSINEFIDNQEQKERERKRIELENYRERKRIELENYRERKRIELENYRERKRIELENQRKEKYREQERIKRLNDLKMGKPYRPCWMEEKIKGCLKYPTKNK